MNHQKLLLAGIALVALAACKKSGSSPDPKLTVYVSGTVGISGSVTYGVCWKNGLPDTIANTNALTGVIVSGNNVYLFSGPTWWMNGTPTTIPGDVEFTKAIAVSSSDVYVAGSTYTSSAVGSNTTAAAIYWKNGVEVNLTKDTSNIVEAFTTGIAVAGSDVYVCGYLNNNAVYWKNGRLVYLTNGYEAKAIAVSGSDVYVAGISLNGNQVYWKNGVEVLLGQDFVINAMAVSGSDIYLAGYTGNYAQAAFFKNGMLYDLPGGYAANSIAISGKDIYAAGGANGNFAVYWKNGVVDTLGAGSANGIAVIP